MSTDHRVGSSVPTSSCPHVVWNRGGLGQDTEPQTAPDGQASTLRGSSRPSVFECVVCVNGTLQSHLEKIYKCKIYYFFTTCTHWKTKGSTVVQWLALLPHSRKVPGSNWPSGTFLCGVCVFCSCLREFPASSHTPKARRLIDKSKLTVGVSVTVMVVCLHVSPCAELATCPVSWDGLQPPATLQRISDDNWTEFNVFTQKTKQKAK